MGLIFKIAIKMNNHKFKRRSIIPIFLMMWVSTAFAFDCHPKINIQLPQYILGYGSLMDEQSKRKTDVTAEEGFPVFVKGYQRRWGVHGNLPGLNTTFLSIVEHHAASFNGVIYKLSHSNAIEQYDKREKTYCRKQIDADQLQTYHLTLPAQKQVWIYYTAEKTNQPPSPDFPIVQSYVDVFMRGCIQIEQKFKINGFAKTCINTTKQWSGYWENDRIFPRRPSSYEPFAPQIDTLLKAELPDIFVKIKYK